MSGPAPTFENLLARIQAGDNEAVGTLYTLYSDPVRRVVRRMLRTSLRRRYDSADFVQSVWASFADLPHTAYTFATADELVAFLAKMAYNKVATTGRRHLTEKQGGGREEVSLDLAVTGTTAPLGRTLPGRDHTPSQYIIADERWEKITRGLPPGHVQVLELLRDGHSHVEIAQSLGVHSKAIQRLLLRLRHFMDKQ